MDKNIAITILLRLYQEKYNDFDEYDYETVDEFYAYLGYDLELHHELPELNIQCTSDLQEALIKSSKEE